MKITYRKIEEAILNINNIGNLASARKAIFALARNLGRFESEIKVLAEERKKIWSAVFGEVLEAANTDKRVVQFNNEMEPILSTETEVNVLTFKLGDLNLDSNSISPRVLLAISFMISDFDTIDAASL